jgi:methylmalonyl-CoA mutase cobalamin-binding subunit
VSSSADQPRRRRVLFLGSPFFGYYQHIIEAFESHGFDVDHYNDRPSENSFLKAAIRVRPALVDRIVDRYQAKIISETRAHRYDLIFVVNGKAFTPAFINELKSHQRDAETVLYLWDAIGLYPHVLGFAPLFDRRYTFDSADAATYPSFTLWPLFYTDDYRAIGEAATVEEFEHDIINVCSAHANRYTLMKWLVPDLRAAGLRVFSYLYLNRLQFVYNRVRLKAFAQARAREFNFRTLPVPDYIALLRRSKAVLDVSHSAQTGLTIRTIETLGARRKLVTTNVDVKNYDFYDPSRVLIIDAERPDVSAIKEFVALPQDELDPTIYRHYGIHNWVGEMIGTKGTDG